jgi:hypothetical protein
MPAAAVVILEEHSEGVFLDRYSESGAFAGDTWHQTVELAKEQARFEFDVEPAGWETVPDDVDIVAYAMQWKARK